MKVALDYDQTYTLDPELWDNFIRLLKASGHEVVLLTFRDQNFDWTELMTHLVDDMDCPVYCTGGVAKKWWSQHFGPGEIDVWVDDNPKSILENSTFSVEGLKEWREKDSGGPRPAL